MTYRRQAPGTVNAYGEMLREPVAPVADTSARPASTFVDIARPLTEDELAAEAEAGTDLSRFGADDISVGTTTTRWRLAR